MISKEGISLDSDKIKEIFESHVPKDVTDVQSFMWITGICWKLIEGFSKVANLIISLHKRGKIFVWDQKCEESFNKLK